MILLGSMNGLKPVHTSHPATFGKSEEVNGLVRHLEVPNQDDFETIRLSAVALGALFIHPCGILARSRVR